MAISSLVQLVRPSNEQPCADYLTRLLFFFQAVFCAELVKLITCIGLVLNEEGTFLRFKASLHNGIIKNKTDTVSANDFSHVLITTIISSLK